jgi:hypothetical protein
MSGKKKTPAVDPVVEDEDGVEDKVEEPSEGDAGDDSYGGDAPGEPEVGSTDYYVADPFQGQPTEPVAIPRNKSKPVS